MAEPAPLLAFADLTVDFDGFLALDGVGGRLVGHGVTGLAGANGAGKTTLLHTLLGLIEPTRGTVTVPVDASSLAYCADTPDFEPWLTAREAVAHSLAVAGFGPLQLDDDRISAALDAVGLLDTGRRRVAGFSRGMKLRLGIAAAVVLEPDVLMLDEPTSALDPVGRGEILDLIADLGQRMHVLFSSHQLNDVESVAHDLIVIDHGTVLFDGPLGSFVTATDGDMTIEFGEPVPDPSDRHTCGLDWRRDGSDERIVHVSASMSEVLAAIGPFAECVVSVTRRRASLYDAFVDAVAACREDDER